MLFRATAILMLLLAAGPRLTACSCINVHTPLEDLICHADTTGGLVLELEMTIRIGDNQEARFRVADVHVGTTDLQELNLSGRTSCAWYMSDDDRPGSRFLYFTNEEWLDGNEGQLFTCAMSSNIYRMNGRGTRVEYPVGRNGQNTRLAFRDFPSALSGCNSGSILVNPLRNLSLSNNPGSGLTALLNPGSELPGISDIEVYTAAGQMVGVYQRTPTDGPPQLNLSALRTGVYLVVVRQGVFTKTLRYVKR